jgi:Ca2+-transporting ATPase
VAALCRGATEEALAEARRMAARGLRVLAVATGAREAEEELELVGLLGLADPPRAEVPDAVRRAREAGITTVMITGDHPVTARAIAVEVGILGAGERESGRVLARVSAGDKLGAVREWKARGAVVAMTGDGVNDAPALREADVGIAMGRSGSEVTRESCDVLLTDDNYASIVAAVEEGRGIFVNIRKTLTYLLAGNASELLLMLAAAALGMGVPLLATHLLWINLVTDGLPGTMLVLEPLEAGLMARPPRRRGEALLGRAQWGGILAVGALEAAVVTAAFALATAQLGVEAGRTVAFTCLVFCSLLRALPARNARLTFPELGPLTNKPLLTVIFGSAALQLAVLQFEATRQFFRVEALSPQTLLLTVLAGCIPATVLELVKLVRRLPRRPQRTAAAIAELPAKAR